MSRQTIGRIWALIPLLLIPRCSCDEPLGNAAPDVPQIDVCVLPSPGATKELCYEAEKLARKAELCPADGECSLPELNVDLGRFPANTDGAVTVRVKNSGGVALKLFNPQLAPGSSSRFRLDPSPTSNAGNLYMEIPAESELTFQLELRGTLCGEHSAVVLLTSNDAEQPTNAPLTFDPGPPDSPILINVTGQVGGPCLCARPTDMLAFGEVPLLRSGSRRFSFESCGDEAITISNSTIGIDPDSVFTIDATIYPPGDILQPGELGHVDVLYEPTQLAPPADAGELWIETNAPTAQPYYVVLLTGRGVERPACNLEVFPATSSFGQVSVTLERSFRLFNTGDVACRVHTAQRLFGSTEFALATGAPPPDITIQPNDSANIGISYTPIDTGYDEAVFRFTADDQDAIDTFVDINLSGNPVLPSSGCVMDVQPDSGDFGNTTVGTPVTVTFTFTNLADTSDITGICNISSAEITQGGPDFYMGDLGIGIPFVDQMILPGMAKSIIVTFAPLSEGAKSGILRFSSNDVTGGTRDIPLWGNALGAKLCVDAAGGTPATTLCSSTQPCGSVDFGATVADATQLVTLTNCGAGALRIRGVEIDPAGGLAFARLAPLATALPIDLAPNASTQVSIEYHPIDPAGDFGGFVVLSNAGNVPAARVDLRGNYGGNCTRILRCNPNPIQIGSQEIGTTAVRSAICSNFGTEMLSVSNVLAAGDPSLSLQSTTYGELAPGESFTVQVACTPTAAGTKTTTVTISSDDCDDPTRDLSVTCTGVDPVLPLCTGSSIFEPVEKWRWTSSPNHPQYDDVWATPIVINLTDDDGNGVIDVNDTPDVIFVAFESVPPIPGPESDLSEPRPAIVVAVSGDDGHQLWDWGTLPVTGPDDPNALCAAERSTLAAADIDGDGLPEIIGMTYTWIPKPDCAPSDLFCQMSGRYTHGTLFALEHDGSFKWQSALWHMSDDVLYLDGVPAIGDMDGDGIPEIAFGNSVFEHNGVLRFEGLSETHGEGVGASIFVDLDGDGTNELLAGKTAFDADGSVLWHRDDLWDARVAVANTDSDDYPELIMDQGMELFILEHDGTTKIGPVTKPDVGGDGVNGGHPSVADMDGDGFPEITVALNNRFYLYEHDLTIKWEMPIGDSTGMSGATAFDFEGDGKAEVVYADEEHVWVFNGVDGTVKYQAPRNSRTIIDYPLIVDVDNDGHADILLALESIALGMHGVVCYSNVKNNWVGTRRVWNQHSYHVTNISESGVVPAFESPSWLQENSYRSNPVRCE